MAAAMMYTKGWEEGRSEDMWWVEVEVPRIVGNSSGRVVSWRFKVIFHSQTTFLLHPPEYVNVEYCTSKRLSDSFIK